MKIKLFVSHRIDIDSFVIKNDIITSVYCGAVYKKNKWNKNIIGDNTGDNISELRMNFNELTVQYWVWKNVEADYYGLCHYRRYFALQNENDGHINEQNQIYLPFFTKNIAEKYALDSEEKLKKLCQEYDLIIPKPADVKTIKAFGKQQNDVLELWQAHTGYFFDKGCIELMLKTIKKIKPQYYQCAVDYFKQDKHRGYNCYLMRKDLFFELCDFQFSVLIDMYETIKDTEMLKQYPRTLGYMGEILYGIYINTLLDKNLRQKEIRLLLVGNVRVNNTFMQKLIVFLKLYGKIIVIKYFPSWVQKIIKICYHKIFCKVVNSKWKR